MKCYLIEPKRLVELYIFRTYYIPLSRFNGLTHFASIQIILMVVRNVENIRRLMSVVHYISGSQLLERDSSYKSLGHIYRHRYRVCHGCKHNLWATVEENLRQLGKGQVKNWSWICPGLNLIKVLGKSIFINLTELGV